MVFRAWRKKFSNFKLQTSKRKLEAGSLRSDFLLSTLKRYPSQEFSISDLRSSISSEILSPKYTLVTLILILTSLFSLKTTAQEFHSCKISESESTKYNQLQRLKSLPQITGYDVKSYRLDVQLDPNISYISGSVDVFFEVEADSLNQIKLLLSDSMQVDSVIYDGSSLNYSHLNRTITIDLPQPIYALSMDSIRVFYQGAPISGGLGTFAQDTIPGGGEMIWTLSQPYGASDWWPCKDDLYDKADSVEIAVTTPLAYKVATNGLRKSIDTLGTDHRYTYKTKYPITTYLIAVAVGNYQFFEEYYQLGSDSLLMEHFLFPNETLSQSNNPIGPWLQLYDSLFGEYPFINEKYGHASFTRGGGMEHQTMSFMTGYGGELIAHELVHQWFGDKVTCSSWQDLWLNEGFATYFTGLTYEFNVVHDSFYWPNVRNYWEQASLQFPDEALFRTDTSDVSSLFNQVVYQKGAMFLHMLRWVCGDSAFFAGIKNYANDPAFEYGFASTADLKSHLESASGKNLNEFFKDWFYGKGFPIYTSTWSQSDGELRMNIEQLPSHPSVYFFNIPLPYQLHSGNWDSTIVLNPTFSNQQFSLNISRAIDSISFDPDGWVLAQHDVITSLDQLKKRSEVQVKVYPNPFQNTLTLEGVQNGALINLYDANSRLIDQWYKKEDRLDFQDLSKGMYYIQIEDKEGMISYPIIKQ